MEIDSLAGTGIIQFNSNIKNIQLMCTLETF